MAQDDKTSAKNEAFLKQLEIQRLNKTCNRIIDLRGKVAGECLAYTLGDRIHYLDDRAYLLAKQLVDRFNGRYTVGVYESLLKALKMLDQKQEQVSLNTHKDKLRQDPVQIQYIPFDHRLERKEPRIIYASPIDIIIADVLYHGSTVDISSSSIKITLRRAHTIEQGDTITIHFAGLNKQYSTSLLTNINFKVVKIEHDVKNTYAILIRKRNDNTNVTRWFDEWTQHNDNVDKIDVDDSIFNIASHYYLRLFTQSLTSPLLWLSHSNDPQPIKAFHLMPNGEQLIKYLSNDDGPDLSLLPIHQILVNQDDYLVIIFKLNNKLKSIAVPRNKPELVAKALNFYQNHPHSHALLLHPTKQKISPSLYIDEIAFITDKNEDYAYDLSSRLSSITQTISISDLSSVCLNITSQRSFSEQELSLYSITNTVKDEQSTITPTSFKPYIQRNKQRFFVNTAVIAHIGEQAFKVSTLDLSIDGLSLMLPEAITLPQNTRITVDFTRWQSQTNKHDLTGISFLVKSASSLKTGQTRLGLQRLSHLSATDINQFFKSIIEQNKEKLEPNDRDILTDKETAIYRQFLPATIVSIPLFFGLDPDKKRILQAIATTRLNHAAHHDSLWRALAKIVVPLSEIIKNQGNKHHQPVNFGLYAYQDKAKNNSWLINTDFDFSYALAKELFINRALANEHYIFFQCALMPSQLNVAVGEDDLNTQLHSLRHQVPHKVKQIREVLHGIFGIGNLLDVTDIIEAAYKKTDQ